MRTEKVNPPMEITRVQGGSEAILNEQFPAMFNGKPVKTGMKNAVGAELKKV